MSITQIMQSAVSSLNTQAAAIDITSTNIANINTEGYARRQAILEPLVLDGQTAGVELSQARHVIDRFLETELLSASATTGLYRAQADLHDRLQDFLGRPDLDLTLSARLDQIFASFTQLAVEPDEPARRLQTVDDLRTFAAELNRLSDQIQALRGEAENRVAIDVNQVNIALARIDEFNREISHLKITGENASALIDERQRALNDIAELIDLHVIEASDGQIDIYTRSGVTLLDGKRRVLTFDPAGSVDSGTRFNPILAFRLDPSGNQVGTGEPLYPKLRAGAIKGRIDMRDIAFPQLAAEVGNLSAMVIDQINRVHNAHSAVPAPTSLTGIDTGLGAGDPHGFTGIVDFVQLAADFSIQARATIDFSTPGLTTLGDVVTAVNAALPGASLGLANGVMSFAATAPGSGVAIVDDSTTPSARGGRGFAHFFAMNDLMRASAPAHFDTGFAAGDAHGFGAVGTVDIRVDGPGGQTIRQHTLDFASGFTTFGDVLADLNTAFTGIASFALDADGRLVSTMATANESRHVSVAADSTLRGTILLTFSALFGLGRRFSMDAASSVEVVDRIVADSGLLSTAAVDLTVAAGDPAINVGDNSGALALQALDGQPQSFRAAGGLAAMTTELPRYTALVLGGVGQDAARAASLADDRAILLEEVKARRQSYSGVNLDEELSNMIIYQNAYNAAERMISTANEMFDILLQITR